MEPACDPDRALGRPGCRAPDLRSHPTGRAPPRSPRESAPPGLPSAQIRDMVGDRSEPCLRQAKNRRANHERRRRDGTTRDDTKRKVPPCPQIPRFDSNATEASPS